MFGGINPKQMQGMMKKMGISQTPVPAKRVIIEKEDSRIIIDDPDVLKVMMSGTETWQITGESREESLESEEEEEGISEEDVKMVIDKTGASEEKVREVLEENGGDIASAIMELKE